uniref:Uncharacterized protein n=1 Tax=Romanomermis culicivorax TaxID=13658 RepID=A0A915KDK6_ROMCU
PRLLFASDLLYTKAVKPNPFFICKPTAYFLFLLSMTEAAVDCPFVLPLLPYPMLLPTITTVHFRINWAPCCCQGRDWEINMQIDKRTWILPRESMRSSCKACLETRTVNAHNM